MYPLLATMDFSTAAANFMQSITAPIPHPKARYREENTIRDYQHKIAALAKFFGRLQLGEIHLGHQRLRLTNGDGVWAHMVSRSGRQTTAVRAWNMSMRSPVRQSRAANCSVGRARRLACATTYWTSLG